MIKKYCLHLTLLCRCSATPLPDKKAKLIEVSEEDVIAEGLIKKLLVINENFPQIIKTDNQTNYLLEKAVLKQQDLHVYIILSNLCYRTKHFKNNV